MPDGKSPACCCLASRPLPRLPSLQGLRGDRLRFLVEEGAGHHELVRAGPAGRELAAGRQGRGWRGARCGGQEVWGGEGWGGVE